MSESIQIAYGSGAPIAFYSRGVLEPCYYPDVPVLRSTVKRPDTEVILSYYQSDLAGKTYVAEDLNPTSEPLSTARSAKHERSSSIASSSSAYSSASSPNEPSFDEHSVSQHGREVPETSEAYPAVRRRPSKITDAEQDNQRHAIVELNPPRPAPLSLEQSTWATGSVGTAQDTLPLVRRVGSQNQVTADVHNLLSPTSPRSLKSPRTHTFARHGAAGPLSANPPSSGSIHRKTSSRDVGIVGTRRAPETPRLERLDPPIFQTPQSRPPSPHTATSAAESSSSPHLHGDLAPNSAKPQRPTRMSVSIEAGMIPRPMQSPTYSSSVISIPPRHSRRPNGHSAEPQQRSAPPGSSAPLSAPPAPPASYLYYQPGVHATAGPLPPPPRALFQIDYSSPPPPRPPRLRSPSPILPRKHEDGSTPTSMSAVLSADAKSVSSERSAEVPSPAVTPSPVEEATKQPQSQESSPSDQDHTAHHTREGAFPPSTILVTPPTDTSASVRLVGRSSADRASTLPEGPPNILDSTLPITAEHTGSDRSWVSPARESPVNSRPSSRESGPQSPDLGLPGPVLNEQRFTLRSKKEAVTDDTPQMSGPLKGVLTDMKRFSSLPRTPSFHSISGSVVSMSPSIYSPPPPRPKTRSRWPDAMWSKDVVNRKTALERAMGYAQKINELALYDCGLGDWVISTKERGNSRNSSSRAVNTGLAHPSSSPISVQQPRHTSRASISSEATFPLRPDAYTATDLAPRAIDIIPDPNSPPPALPYPALAQAPHPPPTHRLSTVLSSPSSVRSIPLAGSKTHGGFFSSLGRNHSLKKEDKRSPNSPSKVLTKLPPANYVPTSKPVHVSSAPHVPGGPRAAPGRMQRSQTLILASSPARPPSTVTSSANRRRSNTLKRPSIFGRSGGSLDIEHTDVEFSRQVDKLSDLLPHADRDVLAGYLRRSGQDILAIGQYLEDEKNGVIRRD